MASAEQPLHVITDDVVDSGNGEASPGHQAVSPNSSARFAALSGANSELGRLQLKVARLTKEKRELEELNAKLRVNLDTLRAQMQRKDDDSSLEDAVLRLGQEKKSLEEEVVALRAQLAPPRDSTDSPLRGPLLALRALSMGPISRTASTGGVPSRSPAGEELERLRMKVARVTKDNHELEALNGKLKGDLYIAMSKQDKEGVESMLEDAVLRLGEEKRRLEQQVEVLSSELVEARQVAELEGIQRACAGPPLSPPPRVLRTASLGVPSSPRTPRSAANAELARLQMRVAKLSLANAELEELNAKLRGERSALKKAAAEAAEAESGVLEDAVLALGREKKEWERERDAMSAQLARVQAELAEAWGHASAPRALSNGGSLGVSNDRSRMSDDEGAGRGGHDEDGDAAHVPASASVEAGAEIVTDGGPSAAHGQHVVAMGPQGGDRAAVIGEAHCARLDPFTGSGAAPFDQACSARAKNSSGSGASNSGGKSSDGGTAPAPRRRLEEREAEVGQLKAEVARLQWELLLLRPLKVAKGDTPDVAEGGTPPGTAPSAASQPHGSVAPVDSTDSGRVGGAGYLATELARTQVLVLQLTAKNSELAERVKELEGGGVAGHTGHGTPEGGCDGHCCGAHRDGSGAHPRGTHAGSHPPGHPEGHPHHPGGQGQGVAKVGALHGHAGGAVDSTQRGHSHGDPIQSAGDQDHPPSGDPPRAHPVGAGVGGHTHGQGGDAAFAVAMTARPLQMAVARGVRQRDASSNGADHAGAGGTSPPSEDVLSPGTRLRLFDNRLFALDGWGLEDGLGADGGDVAVARNSHGGQHEAAALRACVEEQHKELVWAQNELLAMKQANLRLVRMLEAGTAATGGGGAGVSSFRGAGASSAAGSRGLALGHINDGNAGNAAGAGGGEDGVSPSLGRAGSYGSGGDGVDAAPRRTGSNRGGGGVSPRGGVSSATPGTAAARDDGMASPGRKAGGRLAAALSGRGGTERDGTLSPRGAKGALPGRQAQGAQGPGAGVPSPKAWRASAGPSSVIISTSAERADRVS